MVRLTHDAPSEVPSFALVKLKTPGLKFHSDVADKYCAPRIFPALSCENSQRSPLMQLAVATDEFARMLCVALGRLDEDGGS